MTIGMLGNVTNYLVAVLLLMHFAYLLVLMSISS